MKNCIVGFFAVAVLGSLVSAQEKQEPSYGESDFTFPSDDELAKLAELRETAIDNAKSDEASDSEYELGTADDLKTTMQLRLYWYGKRDAKSLAKINRSIVPDADSLKAALKDDVDAETIAALLNMYKHFSPKDAEDEMRWAQMLSFDPDQKDIRVYAATTEEIASQSTESAKQFPGGAVDAARKSLKPKTTFYRVEFLEPGKDAGMSYHLFYWDGTDWRMLGPVWRASRYQKATNDGPIEEAAEIPTPQ